jgi:hypothetical protein
VPLTALKQLFATTAQRLIGQTKELPSRLVSKARGFALELVRLPQTLRRLGLRDWIHLVTMAVVWWVAILWLRSWYAGNEPVLIDPLLQPDDARTALFPFHRYAPGHPLSTDPIANEMLEYQPYAYRLLFRFTVPSVGLLVATKWVTKLLFGMFVVAGVVLMTSRRAGLGAGLLFAALFIHDQSIQNRIHGGLPRGFGFPVCALWLAGALAGRPNVRRIAAIVGALTYPTALAMVLGAEGVYVLRGLGRPGFHTLFRRLKHYALLVVACIALLAPAVMVGMHDGGSIHTLAQAEREPAFGKSGRLRVLPFPEPTKQFTRMYEEMFDQYGTTPHPDIWRFFQEHRDEVVIALLALLLALPLMRLATGPEPVLAFFVASLVLYTLSRVFAFKLYSPERYYTLGMRMVTIGLVAGVLGLVAPCFRRWRYPIRNLVCALAIGLMWSGLGNGVRTPPMGVDVDYRRLGPIWDAIKKLPLEARVACQVGDQECDNVPLFGMRANNGGFETMQPWLVKSWKRQLERAEDTTRAIYATKPEELFSFANKYKVSHFLIQRSRLAEDFRSRSRSFEPLSSFTRKLLEGKQASDFLLGNVPRSAEVLRFRGYVLISVAKLKEAWGKTPP